MYISIKDVFFISHNDADGYMAMANMFESVIGFDNIIGNPYIKSEKQMAIQSLDYPDLFLNLNYPMEFPYEKVPENRIVFITDYSFTEDTIHILYEIAKKSKRVIWTDHHKTSMWYKSHPAEEIDEKIIAILYDGSSSTMTTHYINKFLEIYLVINNYSYISELRLTEALYAFMDNLTDTPRKVAEYIADIYEKDSKANLISVFAKTGLADIEPPMYIKLIDDYDIWKHEYDTTLAFHYGLDMFNHGVYVNLIRDNNCGSDKTMLDIFEEGDVIERYINLQNEEISTKYSFVRRFFYDEEHGMVDILCVNSRGNSFVFGDKFDKYPFCLLYHYDGDEWKYSIYCHKKYLEQGYDASIIAKDYGGGGHAGASGFSTKNLLEQLM